MVFKKGQVGFWNGKHLSEGHIQKLSEAHIGQKAWNKGKKGYKILKKDRAIAIPVLCACGCNQTVWGGRKYIRGHNQAHKGCKHSERTKTHWSNIRKGKMLKETTKEKMMGRVPWNKGIDWVELRGEKHPRYSGGKRVSDARMHHKRHLRGFMLITNKNPYDEPIEYHHIDPNLPYVVPCPKRIHQMFPGKTHFQNVNAMLGISLPLYV